MKRNTYIIRWYYMDGDVRKESHHTIEACSLSSALTRTKKMLCKTCEIYSVVLVRWNDA